MYTQYYCECNYVSRYYTIIDFNEVDMMIYLPKKWYLLRPQLKSITVLLYDFSAVNDKLLDLVLGLGLSHKFSNCFKKDLTLKYIKNFWMQNVNHKTLFTL